MTVNTVTLLALAIVLTSGVTRLADAKCLCSVKKTGEYCGTELNSLNSENDCPKKMFFCGDNNRDKEAVILVDCPSGKECDIKTFSK